MVGMIITGHAHFGTGMKSALTLLAGELNAIEAIDFEEGCTKMLLEAKIDEKCTKLLEVCDGVVIFCDLLGGTPFQCAALYARGREDVKVLAGTNLGMLSEANLTRQFIADLDELAKSIETIGKDSVLYFQSKTEGN
ncbi:PTS sugar transporter subunit IIA [Dubosiella newyorkensis]|jgi:PTS system N-acetylgalactosamine-specific IIA component|uniref:PTS sugar transporter subunit IIA n=2 Tax=Dubosiella newyorkensis TaxID=1862672 RepID=UPI002355C6E9|nr:PTS sugar transporter subunit IIA [Dubosiella newyorkensis]MCI9040506.1 PTS sugar transporter subunit IIA [Dubosiella newyorkensis]